MRIAYVAATLAPGGAEQLMLNLARGMARRDHAVQVVSLRRVEPGNRPADLDVASLDMGKSLWGLAGALIGARRQLRAFQPDLVHSHTYFANIFARLVRCVYGAPVVNTIHNVYEGGRLRMLGYRATDPLCPLTTAVCQAAADRYLRQGAVRPERCLVTPNAIDAGAFQPDGQRRLAMRAEMGLAAEEFVWLAAGRVSPAKDYPNLLRAFSLVRARRPDARLWIAGGVSTGLSLARAAQSEPAEGVRWLGHRQDMAALLDAADGFVLASAWEGMPLVVAEAMAMEKPVAATDVGGVRELTGETGRLAPAKKPEVLAAAMLETMALPSAQRAETGRRARRRIEESFDLEPWLDRWEGIYRAVLTERR